MSASKRLSRVPASPIRKLVPLSQAAKAKGVKVYHLNIGDPDIETPLTMLEALHLWQTNPIGYAQSQGDPAFLSSLTSYYRKLGFAFMTPGIIQITSGGSEAISMALFAACEAGDEVLVFEPFYANYNTYAAVTGVTLIPVRTEIATGFHLPDRSHIEKAVTQKTKAILFCNPNNPTGTVYTKEEVEMLVDLARKHGLFLLSDEVYREYTYDGRKHVSILSYMKEIPDLAVLLDSMSKRYSLCGVRLGLLASLNREVMAGSLRIAQGRLSCGLVDQAVAAKLTEVPDSYLTSVHKEYEERRTVLYEGLKAIAGVTVTKPEGAFYVIVGLPVSNAEAFCAWLLTDFSDKGETVMLAPAAGFYATQGLGINEVRIAYVLNQKALRRSIAILSKALSVFPGRIPQ